MNVAFHGAAREVTGSCHVVHVGRSAVALDFGLFQGHRNEANEKNLALPFTPDDLNAVILSHAHLDHAGRLPVLARLGFNRPVYATPATRELCAIMLADAARLAQRDAEYLTRRNRPVVAPLYDERDVGRLMDHFVCVPYDTPFAVAPGIRATFVDAGHILGSASVVLECTENGATRRLVYSGDIGRRGLPIIRDPHPPNGADAVIMESTYGDRDHASVADMPAQLARVVRDTAARGGRVLIPAFAVGRAQELLLDLHALRRSNAIPPIPVILDSPLAIAATSVFAEHRETLDLGEPLVRTAGDFLSFEGLELTQDVAASKALNSRNGPMIIIAGSGMVEGGRILHHLLRGAPDPRNTILIVGFMAENTLGRRIVERRPALRILGEEVPLRARVEILNGYSAHADRGELHDWVRAVRGAGVRDLPVFLVHGEAAAQDAFAARLRADGFAVTIPERGAKVVLDA
ncbi:MAG TPA: MBL fold metallo-hydrolase [Gemmatimonadaceae bacterium]|nr:MBL fold metallo-hydrolase [Gemmatimonadaceae bacterium]